MGRGGWALAGLWLLLLDTMQIGSLNGLLLCFGSMFCAMLYTVMSSGTGQPRIGFSQSAKQYLELCDPEPCVFLPLGQEIALPETTMGWIAILSNGIFYLLGYWLFFEGCRPHWRHKSFDPDTR